MTRNVKALFDPSGLTAPITGGSRGLGLLIAEALGEAGATVRISSRKAADLEAAALHLRDRGIPAHWIAADSSKDADMARLAQEAIAKLGKIDILGNNAGASASAPAEEHPVEGWDKGMNVNIRGIFLLTQHIGRDAMLPRKRGCILHVASIAGLGGNPAFMKTIAHNDCQQTPARAPASPSPRRWRPNGGRRASGSMPSRRGRFAPKWLRACSPPSAPTSWPPKPHCAAPATMKTSKALPCALPAPPASTSPAG